MQISVEWAINAKDPGDTHDYRLIANSRSPEEGRLFEDLFRQYPVNIPQFSRADDQAKVGLTLAPTHLLGEPHILAMRYQETMKLDARGRPIIVGCCFFLPYGSLAAIKATYQAIYRSLPAYEAMLSLAGAVEINIEEPPASLVTVEQTLETVGFELAAAGAAGLLHKRVALVSRTLPALEDRLQGLDAIAGLLPYGAKLDLSCSTWTDSAGASTVRLSFTDQSRDDQLRLAWREMPGRTFDAGEIGESYRSALVGVRRRFKPQQILGHLASIQELYNFAAPGGFLAALQNLDEPYLLWQQLTEKRRPDPGRVQKLVSTTRYRSLEDSQQRDVLTFLLTDPNEENLRLLRTNWRLDLATSLRKTAIESFRSNGGNKGQLVAWCGLARDQEFLADLLLDLFAAAENGKQQDAENARQVLIDAFVSSTLQQKAPSPQDSQRIRFYIVTHPSVLYQMFIFLAKVLNEAKLTSWLAWAEADASYDDVRILRTVLGPTWSDTDDGNRILDRISSVDPGLLTKLFGVSKFKARLAEMVADWMVTRAAGRDRIAPISVPQLCSELVSAGSLSCEAKAQVDLAVAALDPSAVLPFFDTQLQQSASEFRRYVDAIQTNVERFGGRREPALKRLASCCLGAEITCADALKNKLFLLDKLNTASGRVQSDKDRAESLSTVILDGLRRFPDVCESEQFRTWASDLERWGLAWRVMAIRVDFWLSRATPSAGELASRCAQIILEGRTEGLHEVIRLLRKLPQPWQPQDFDSFVTLLTDALTRANKLAAAGIEIVEKYLITAALSGQLDQNLARSYPIWLVQRATVQISRLGYTLEQTGGVRDAAELTRLKAALSLVQKGMTPKRSILGL